MSGRETACNKRFAISDILSMMTDPSETQKTLWMFRPSKSAVAGNAGSEEARK